MFKSFNYSIEQQVFFEQGCIKKLPEIIKEINSSRVYIVSDRGLEKAGLVKKLTDLLEEAEVKYDLFLDVEPNPSVNTVQKALEGFKNSGADSMVALGGGSSMDVAKAVGVLYTHGGELKDYEGFGKVPGEIVPLIAIATTAGTGSESTGASVVTDTSTSYKFSVGSFYLVPKYAILDPELITTLPALMAAATGIDALVHAIETYISLNSNMFTDALAEKAIELIGKYLRRFTANRQDIEAASGMLIGSNLAGAAFARASLGNVHALAHPVSGFFNVPHGVANAILLPVVLEFNALTDSGKYERIFRLLKGDHYTYTNFTPDMLVTEIRSLIASLEIPMKLSEVGVTEDKLQDMCIDAMKSRQILINPRLANIKDVENLFRKAF